MKLHYSRAEVERWRDQTHRRTAKLRVKNEKQALSFINDVGFCLASKSQGLELPNLWDAVARGMSAKDEEQANRSYYLSYACQIQNILPNHNSVYYGKLFKRRPSVVSLEYFAYFFALSDRTGAIDEHKTEHLNGKISGGAKSLMDILLKHGPLTTKELRSYWNQNKQRPETFEKSLDILQRKMFISRVVGTGDNFSAIWAPVLKSFSTEVHRARKITTDQARYKLLEKYFHTQLISSIEQIHNVFNWQRKDIFHAIGELINAGIVTSPAILESDKGNYYCLVRSSKSG